MVPLIMRVSLQQNLLQNLEIGNPLEDIERSFFDNDLFYQLDNGVFYRGEVIKGTKVPNGIGILFNTSCPSKKTIRIQWFREGLMRGDYTMIDQYGSAIRGTEKEVN